MSDLISRQAAIDIAEKAFIRGLLATPDLRRLPAAQPEIVRCKDCIHNNNCDIQFCAQAGDLFFCGFGETEEDVKKDVYG